MFFCMVESGEDKNQLEKAEGGLHTAVDEKPARQGKTTFVLTNIAGILLWTSITLECRRQVVVICVGTRWACVRRGVGTVASLWAEIAEKETKSSVNNLVPTLLVDTMSHSFQA